MAVDVVTGLGFDAIGDILRRNGSERLAPFPGFEHEGKFEFAETLGRVVGFIEFAGFAFSAARLERVGHAQRGGRHFMGQAAGNEKIARVAAAHFDHVGLGPEARDVGS